MEAEDASISRDVAVALRKVVQDRSTRICESRVIEQEAPALLGKVANVDAKGPRGPARPPAVVN